MSARASELWWLFTRQTVSVMPMETIRDALRLMVRRGFRHLPVVNDAGAILGIISAQDIIDALAFMIRSESKPIFSIFDKSVEKIMSRSLTVAMKDASISDVVSKMSQSHIGAIPIIEANQTVVGIVTLRDLVSLMGVGHKPLGVPVKEVMTTDPALIRPDATVMEAISLLSAKRVRRLPVVDRPDGEAVGIVTNKDLLRYLDTCLAFQLIPADEVLKAKVSKVMTTGVVTAKPSDDVRYAAYTMMTMGIGGLVVHEKRILGVITERDLVHKMWRLKGEQFFMRAIVPSEDHSDRPSW